MNPQKKISFKSKLKWYIVGFIIVAYFSIIISCGAGHGYSYKEWYERMSMIMPILEENLYGLKNPLWFTKYTTPSFAVYSMFYCVLAYTLGILMYYTSKRNYIAGKEFGTAKYADISYINKRLAENDESTSEENKITGTYRKGLKQQKYVINTLNRQISEHVYMSLNTRKTDLNNNILVIGGSGAGKTFKFVKPMILSNSSSFIITDPKGEILRDTGQYLKDMGYRVIVLNLLNEKGMRTSNKYNPFRYIRNDTDVLKLVTNIISNTTPKNSTSSDPFWEKSESMLISSLIFYIRDVYKNNPEKQNFKTFMELLSKAKCETDEYGQRIDSELDELFTKLEEKENRRIRREEKEGKIPKSMSMAVLNYNSVMRGAADTVRSIIIAVNSRLQCLKTDEILNLLSDDEIDIPELGAGVDYDEKTKTALFCVIPDNDKTYNFLIGVLYSQIFVELYHQADFVYNGRLPINVTFLLDEFANVALPDDYCSLISTMRSREISSVIIIQNLAQIKALFKDTWESITGNCDTTVYLGGNEQSTHEYISKLLGKATFDKRTSGETKGKQGSSSRNYDVLGRELLLPEEVRKVDGKKCLVFIRGYDPIFDDKIHTTEHPHWEKMCSKQYVYEPDLQDKRKSIRFISDKAINTLEKEQKEDNVLKILDINGEDLIRISTETIMDYMPIDDNDFSEFIEEKLLIANEERINEENEKAKEIEKNKIGKEELADYRKYKDGVIKVLKLRRDGYTDEKIRALTPLFEKNMKIEEITSLFPNSMNIDEITNTVELIL